MDPSLVERQLPYTLAETRFGALGAPARGKVRDTYRKGDRLVIVTTDRISAFDHVLGTIPFKGEILNRTAAFWFDKTRDVAKNHLLEVPDPNVMLVRACRPLPVELVVRGYLTGSLWRDVQSGAAQAYGLAFPDGMERDRRFDAPIITPTTKAELGKHDLPISRERIVGEGLVVGRVWDAACERALALFERGQAWASGRGLILVDTKYEFGLSGDELLLIDEIHTMDSSRYWELEGYEDRLRAGADQKMLDKENVRQWLIRERGFSGQGTPPELTDAVRVETARVYATAFERITGEPLQPEVGDAAKRIERNLSRRGLLA